MFDHLNPGDRLLYGPLFKTCLHSFIRQVHQVSVGPDVVTPRCGPCDLDTQVFESQLKPPCVRQQKPLRMYLSTYATVITKNVTFKVIKFLWWMPTDIRTTTTYLKTIGELILYINETKGGPEVKCPFWLIDGIHRKIFYLGHTNKRLTTFRYTS